MPAIDFASWLQAARAALTLIVLTAAIVSFVREKLPPDVTSLLALLALLLFGVLSPEEAFSGFSHPATISVCAMLVLTAGLQHTGALDYLARRIVIPLGRWEWLLVLVLMAVTALLSAFVANTATVAVFIPVVLEACKRTGASPGRILMPMAHAATFGGMCTLIGTSTNLAAHEFARSRSLPGFHMFEFASVGLPMLLVGFAYVFFIGRRFLPKGTPSADSLARAGPYEAELVVTEDSSWVGREVRPKKVARDFDVELVRVRRAGGSLVLDAEPAVTYAAGDRLQVRGSLERVLAMGARAGLNLRRPQRPVASPEGDTAEPAPRSLAEVVVLPRAPFLGQTLADARFVERYDAAVLALHRPGERFMTPMGRTPLHAGDVLLVEGEVAALQALAETPGVLVAGTPSHPEPRKGKVGIALLTIVGVVVVVAAGWMPIVTAATAGCALLMVTRCLEPREAYAAVDWSIVFVLAGALAFGTALQKTGLASGFATLLAELPNVAGPMVVLAGFFIVASVASEFLSNSGTVLLLGPIAVTSAEQMGLNPMALMAAITFGSSSAFALPIGYQTSLMIYGPGGYRFRDFVRMGLVLDVLLALIALYFIPRHWPLLLE